MTELQFNAMVSNPLGQYTDEELAALMIYKAEHIKAHIPAILFKSIAARLKNYSNLKKITRKN